MLRHAAALTLAAAILCGTASAGADVLARIEVGNAPCSVAFTPGAAWVAVFRDDRVVRIDTATN